MTHDIFLSYAREDALTANQICKELEAAGLAVWMAPRDVLPSVEWPAAIIDAIGASRLMLLVFSAHANGSKQVLREVDAAASRDIPIVPIRIDDVLPSGSMEFFLNTPHWFDALPLPVDAHIPRLIGDVRLVLAGAEHELFVPSETPLRPARPAQSRGPEEQRLLSVLRDRVRRFWIDGVLLHSFEGGVPLSLDKVRRVEAVENPWERAVELPANGVERIASETSVERIFEEAGRALLILGEPGSGKTTTLLELARDLIDRSDRDASAPIPIVFNLSTWSVKRPPLLDWLTDELRTKYFVGTASARRWIQQLRLVLLLDGLDEVHASARPACVTAINAFAAEHGFAGLVVSCRRTEYAALTARLRLNGAILLGPLTDSQIDTYMHAPGRRLAGLRAALTVDRTLLDLARTPLMLNVMSLAYDNVAEADLADDGAAAGLDSRRSRIFDRYVGRMFERRREGNASRAQTDHRDGMVATLAWLARQMRARSISVFQVEQLQPIWLASGWERLTYLLATRLCAMSIFTLLLISGAFAMGATWGSPSQRSSHWVTVIFYLLAMIMSVAGDVAAYQFSLRRAVTIPAGALRALALFLLYFAVASIGLHLVSLVEYGQLASWTAHFAHDRLSDPSGTLLTPANQALVFWLAFGLRASTRSFDDDIRADRRLQLRPRWMTVRKGSSIGAIGAAVTGLVWLTSHLVRDYAAGESLIDLRVRLSAVLLMIAVSWVAGGLASVLLGRTEVVDIASHRMDINQGIRNGIAIAVYRGVVSAGFAACVVSFVDFMATPGTPPSPVVFVAVTTGVISGILLGGGLDAVYHYILRGWLRWRAKVPLGLPKLLAEAERLIFIRRVGTGYIFVHPLLHDYFASRAADGSAEPRREIGGSD
jgi:DNA polymerase III delta prime subunit